MNIKKNMVHIWIGPKLAPKKWMNTWKDKHPDWNYSVFTQSDFERRKFENQKHIDDFMSKGIYAGAADMIRYELLYENGGFLPPADALCLENTDELWVQPEDYCYTVYESEKLTGKYVSPIYACNEGNTFVKMLIDGIKAKPFPLDRRPWISTGNAYVAEMIKKHEPKVHIFPSHYFIPTHFRKKNIRYDGPDKIYADQMWGSTGGGKDYKEGIK